jgi:hypothetical protein
MIALPNRLTQLIGIRIKLRRNIVVITQLKQEPISLVTLLSCASGGLDVISGATLDLSLLMLNAPLTSSAITLRRA